MRAIVKASYFDHQKQTKRKQKPDKLDLSKIKRGSDKLENYYLRHLASAFQELMIWIMENLKRELNIIEKLSNKINLRIMKEIFIAWKAQSEQPQPYKLQMPYSPPRKDLTCRSARSATKQQVFSKTPKNDIKFYTPGRDSIKTLTTSRITKEEDDSSVKIANLFRLKKIWNRIKLFANFQKHLAFKSRHFRNFYIIRKYFTKLQSIVYFKKLKLEEYQKSKIFYTLRVSFSKWYEHGQRKKLHVTILMKSEQKQKILLMRKGLKALFLNAKESKKKVSAQNSIISQSQSIQQKKLKLIPKKN